jgi:beta-glucosidase
MYHDLQIKQREELNMEPFRFKKEFMLGVSTSSTQIEGVNKNNTWYEWCTKGDEAESKICHDACDHWNRVKQDTELLKDLHVQTYRMSLDWSRIETSPGEYSIDSIQHYRGEIQLLLESNIRPLVTLHHFSEPVWFQNSGGWLDARNSERFIDYAVFVVKALGDIVSDWVIFNEPNVYAIFGYLFGVFPPGIRSIKKTLQVATQLMQTHIRLYELIHSIRNECKFEGETMVGTAIHFRVFDGLTFLGKKTAAFVEYIFHDVFVDGISSGRLRPPLSYGKVKMKKGMYLDFLGVNYYTRNVVEFALDPSLYFHKLIHDTDLDKSDLGWDIYPEGIYRICKKYYRKCKLPIFITENGISDQYDNRRPLFIVQHLSTLAKAIDEGIPIERYYHWTLMDNYEWNEDESIKFGLYSCDLTSQERSARKSAELYAQLCRKHEFTEEMIAEFWHS